MIGPRAWLWASVVLTIMAVVCAVILAPPVGAPPATALSWLLFTGSSVHVASTGWLFTLPTVRAYARNHPARCRWVPLSLIAGGAAAAGLITPTAFRWVLLPYLGWQFWHYQKQNVGLASLAASARRVSALLPAERRPLLLAGLAGIAELVTRPGLAGLHLQQPWWSANAHLPVLVLAGSAYVLGVAAGIAALARRPRQQRPAGLCATYLAGLLFWLPAFAFNSPYAAVGGMTIAHGAQYLLLIALIAGGRTRAARNRFAAPVRLALLANVAFLGGAALSAASHLHDAGSPGRCVFGAYLGIVMAHFVIDAGLWRMRDPLARDFLVTHLRYLVSPDPASPEIPPPSRLIAPADPSPADIECQT